MVVYCLYQLTTTCYSVPYSAITMEISENSIERDSATAWRMTSELFATSLGVVLFGLVLAQLAPEGSSSDAERRVAYFVGSLAVCCFVVVPGYITTCCVPERPEYCLQTDEGQQEATAQCSQASETVNDASIRNQSSRGDVNKARTEGLTLEPAVAQLNPTSAPGFFSEWLAGLRLAFSCRAYLVLMLCFLCSGLTFQLTSNNLNLYLRHTLDLAEQFQIIVSNQSARLCAIISRSARH